MILEEKKALRKTIRILKAALPDGQRIERSNKLLQEVSKSKAFQKAETILMYYSMDDEVHTHEFVEQWHKSKTILLPVVKGDELELKIYTGTECLVKGEQFGIPEPSGENFTAFETIDFMLIPGVAFDKQNNRMGRGRGFYDRLLALSNSTKAGVCFNFQMVESVPHETHDIKMDMVFHD
jgi:5-formyltetrahydrofolate cyclo-ligase